MQSVLTTSVDGVSKCARYAFGPNKLRMCGPDMQRELGSYIDANATDAGLNAILGGFRTLYPYLQTIAKANHIADPFDLRVVEAYWLGNQLLETISPNTFYSHLRDVLGLKKKIQPKSFDELTEKLPRGARMHHSFHVFNVYKRTGHFEILHTLESMDACRISWGSVTSITGPKITVDRKPLMVDGHRLYLGPTESVSVVRRLDDDHTFEELSVGDMISMHWGMPCEIITPANVRWLEYYTQKHLQLANQTL